MGAGAVYGQKSREAQHGLPTPIEYAPALPSAEKIRLIMKRQNKTMGDIAEASGQTRQNLSNKMTRGNFTEKDILALAGALVFKIHEKM